MVPGQKIQIVLIRNQHEITAEVTVGEQPSKDEVTLSEKSSSSCENSQTTEQKSHLKTQIGIEVQVLTCEIAQELGYSEYRGVVVSTVKAKSPSDESGLRRGDVIEEINRQSISSLAGLEQIIDTLGKDDSSVLLLIRRGENRFFVTVPLYQ